MIEDGLGENFWWQIGADQTTACSVIGGFSFECNSTYSCGKTDREEDWARIVASDNVDELHGRLVVLIRVCNIR